MSFKLERPQADYTVVCNGVLRDTRLSLRAKGLYALMFSKRDGWVFHEAALMKESTEGRDALRAAFRELIQAGWLSKLQPREGGKFDHNTYRLHLTVDWKSGDGLTDDGKPTSNKTDERKTEKRERALRLEVFLEGKVTNGIGCPLGWWQWASDQFKWPAERCQAVFDTFRDYWKAQPGQKGVKADWEATWRNWCRRESSFQKPTKLEKGAMRESTPQEKAEAEDRVKFLELVKANPGKTEAEIIALMRAA